MATVWRRVRVKVNLRDVVPSKLMKITCAKMIIFQAEEQFQQLSSLYTISALKTDEKPQIFRLRRASHQNPL